MESILYETGQIEVIVENLLALSKYDKESFSQSYEAVDLSSLLLGVLEQYAQRIGEKEIKVDITCLEPIVYTCNKQLVATVFSNLMDNALKYSPKKSIVRLSLCVESGRPVFSIEDEGRGIPAEDIEKITERFYRVDQSRTRRIKGFGLGLSIAKNILDLHGALLDIRSEVDRGTIVRVVFLK